MKLMLDLFEKQLQNLYNSELLILNTLPEMLDYATDGELVKIIETYIQITYNQKQRLVEIGDYLHIKFNIDDGQIIIGLLEETRDLFREFPKGFLMDVGIIAKLRHVQHFQISAYETAILYAKALNIPEVAAKLDASLWEAYEGDEDCSSYAKKLIYSRNKRDNNSGDR